MKLLKIALISIAALLGVVIVAGAAAFILIPADKLAALASDEVRKTTGRDLVIAGEVSPSLYPVLGATVSQAALSNPDWAKHGDMISVGTATVGVRVAPLLSGRLEVEEIRLTDVAIALEVAEDGRASWVFDGADDGDRAAANAPAERGPDDDGDGLERLGRVQLVLENAAITYDNRATGASFTTRDLSLAAVLEDPHQPLTIDGAGVFNDQDVSLSLKLATPAILADGEAAQADLAIGFGGAKLNFSGLVSGDPEGGAPSAKGVLSASAPDIPALMAALGAPPPKAPEGALKSAALDGQLTTGAGAAEISGLVVSLDGQTISGDAAIDVSGARPMITVALMADDLDLSAYTRGGGGGSGGDGGGGGAQDGWSKEPIDLSGLKAVDADVTVKAHSIILDKGAIRDADLHAKLRNGLLTLTIAKLQMFDGGAMGTVSIDGSGVPAVAADLNVDSVQLLSLLATLADFDRLEGVGAASVKVTGGGGDVDAIMRSLDGSGSIKLTDGAVLGLNLAAMVRNAAGAFLGDGGQSQKTDFAEVSANFAIANGVATNSDLIFLGPLLRANGAGTIDIGARSLKYRVTPRAVASLKGQGGDAGLGGVAVPVLVTGPWSNPKFAPDLAGAISGIVTDPASLAGAALGSGGTGIGGALGGAVEGILGQGADGDAGSTGGAATEKNSAADAIGGALKGLFGR